MDLSTKVQMIRALSDVQLILKRQDRVGNEEWVAPLKEQVERTLDRLTEGGTPIDWREFSTRAYHILSSVLGVSTIEELGKYTEADLLREPNFGRKSLYEVQSYLYQNGIWGWGRPRHPRAELEKIPLPALDWGGIERALGNAEKSLKLARERLAEREPA